MLSRPSRDTAALALSEILPGFAVRRAECASSLAVRKTDADQPPSLNDAR
jgi:hypothetical protein